MHTNIGRCKVERNMLSKYILKANKKHRMDPIDVIKLYTENILPLPKYINISIHILHLFPPTCA